jgi:Kef-type K+ transport system membrane component KefB
MAFMVTFVSTQFGVLLDDLYQVQFHVEPMLICVTAGFWVQNFSRAGGPLMEQIDRSSLPIYVVLFGLTGAALDVESLRQSWLVAVLLVLVRLAMMWLSGYAGARGSDDPPAFQRLLGLAFSTQAGVSLGLAAIVVRRFPGWGAELATTLVGVIALNQIIGPIALKYALNAVGEARARSTRRTASPAA